MLKKKRFNLWLLLALLVAGVASGVFYYETHAYGPLVSAYDRLVAREIGEFNALSAARSQAIASDATCASFAQNNAVCPPLRAAISASAHIKPLERVREGASREEVKKASARVRVHIDEMAAIREKLRALTETANESQRVKASQEHTAVQAELTQAIADLKDMIARTEGRVLDDKIRTDASDAVAKAQASLKKAVKPTESVAQIRMDTASLRALVTDLKARADALYAADSEWAAQNEQQGGLAPQGGFIAPQGGVPAPQDGGVAPVPQPEPSTVPQNPAEPAPVVPPAPADNNPPPADQGGVVPAPDLPPDPAFNIQ
ncbi:MAG: major capsid protein [Arcanobacterium sp.]|nr:major capsid protein [Arcanobacterium sp.]MDY5588825.1 hypothetical protein [Arcanobacterium sp.]